MVTPNSNAAFLIDNSDLSVIDTRAPRFNQVVVAVASALGVWTGFWPLLAIVGTQLAISVLFGRRYCLPCLFFFEFLQPRLGPGSVEDSRAPRFANAIGAVFLLSASTAYLANLPALGFVLGALVAVLAALGATTGLCVGCELYRLIARMRGLRGGVIEKIDADALKTRINDGSVVLFTHPLCGDCQVLHRGLEDSGAHIVTVDVSKRRDLAKKYGISVVPLAFVVDGAGRVTRRLR